MKSGTFFLRPPKRVTSWIGLCAALSFLFATGSADAALLAEDFDSVTGVSGSVNRTVADILANTPGQLAAGSVWASIPDITNAANVNVRQAGDPINTTAVNAAPAPGFGGFFSSGSASNQYLVLGDQSGVIGGNPTGGLFGEVFGYAVPFTIQPGISQITVSFDWAFNGVDSSLLQQDSFIAGLVGGSLNWTSMNASALASLALFVNQTSPAGYGSSQVSQTVSGLAAGTYYLVFALTEASGASTNSAVGIDNISVAAVPLPASLWLLGWGIWGVLAASRRRGLLPISR